MSMLPNKGAKFASFALIYLLAIFQIVLSLNLQQKFRDWFINGDKIRYKSIYNARDETKATNNNTFVKERISDEAITSVMKWIDEPIRSWGCNIMETPFIFVHIGKAGGGEIRRKIASAADNVTRNQWYKARDDKHFYPIKDDKTKKNISHGRFCNSGWRNHRLRINGDLEGTFEGTAACGATTPLGRMVACPDRRKDRCEECAIDSDSCRTIYTGHNYLGSELHWLPPKVLKRWWTDVWSFSKEIDTNFSSTFASDLDITSVNAINDTHCKPNLHSVLKVRRMTERWIEERCSDPLGASIDTQTKMFWEKVEEKIAHSRRYKYSTIYSSLPVRRATMMREPYSWLLSKYFWQNINSHNKSCDDVEYAAGGNDIKYSINHDEGEGWINSFGLEYLLYLCGEECLARYQNNMTDIDEIALQAEGNVRHGFAVVGLLNDTDGFYDMLERRFGYFDIRNSSIANDARHRSGSSNECKAKFLNETFREALRTRIPIVKKMEHLYNIAVEVNQFQRIELDTCNK